MKKLITIIILSLVLVFTTSITVVAKNHRGNKDYRNNEQQERYHGHNRGDHHSRNHKHHYYHGKKYDYKGHYGSWNEWERYKKRHPNIERRGRYYRQDGHLMFGFSDSSGSFFFSIGR